MFFRWICRGESGLPGLFLRHLGSSLQLVSEISKEQAFLWMGEGFRTKTPYILKDKVMALATSVLHLCLYIIFSFIPSSHFVKDLKQLWKSLVELVVKNPPANAGDVREAGSIPGSGRSPRGRHGNPLQYSCLENLTGEPNRVSESQTGLKRLNRHSGKAHYISIKLKDKGTGAKHR